MLIEEKSAWDVLQDLANLTCSYIYCNRLGQVVVSADRFDNSKITKNNTDNLTSINPSNSFSYSLPVISQTVVNSVNTEYYELEEAKNKETSFDFKDYIWVNDTVTVVLELKNIHSSITSIQANIYSHK